MWENVSLFTLIERIDKKQIETRLETFLGTGQKWIGQTEGPDSVLHNSDY